MVGGGEEGHSFELFLCLYQKRLQFGLFKKSSALFSDGLAG